MASNSPATGQTALLEAAAPRPMIVADNAHVNYRVYASGKRMAPRERLFSGNALRGGRGLKTVPALRGVTFTASEGETIGVVGHNGSGKSTLFRAMSGLVPTAEGVIWARDRPVLLGVNAALVPSLSGENNIKLGLLAMGFSAEEAAAQVGEIADFAELNEFIHHPMKTYSSGMGARLRFAIASAKAHSILLVDEALAVGDRRFRAKSEKRIAELRNSAGLVMIVSHSVGSLRDTCDRVLWVHKGELRADGDANEVIADYVKWTKDPKSVAVGAASKPPSKAPAKASAASTPAATVAAPQEDAVAATPPAKPAEERQGLSLFDEILHGLEPETPQEAARATTGSISRIDADARATTRRERYQQEAERRVRKRIIATLITGGAILAAVGVGAAFALATSGAASTDRSQSTPPATTGDEQAAAHPAVIGFSAAPEPVACASEDADGVAKLSWEVTGATYVQVALTSTPASSPDALPETMPAKAASFELPFTCSAETQSYTLIADNDDGVRVSKAVIVTRALPSAAPEAPQTEVVAPPRTDPEPPPSDPPANDPPTTEPPTTPEPPTTENPEPPTTEDPEPPVDPPTTPEPPLSPPPDPPVTPEDPASGI